MHLLKDFPAILIAGLGGKGRKMAKKAVILILASLILLFLSSSAFSQEPPLVLPKITIEAGEVDEPQELVLSLRILLLLTILSLRRPF